jgi:hypothetical protein
VTSHSSEQPEVGGTRKLALPQAGLQTIDYGALTPQVLERTPGTGLVTTTPA